ncbi:cupin [Streptomyces sp. Ru62]|uniref:cupin domain-containing protein n=1 Tax=Streptomyces sp. Ru62 TaxID=2080745 RepID=UPI000CDD906D|nr:cupin domain-containing protein [Streptomyces sp. Ru62]POX63534.1 cupin [Streptomyces sp. Ru62]
MSYDRFVLLGANEARPGRVLLPPAFAVKATTADTEGRFSLLEVVLGQPIPCHTHHLADESVYVLEGELLVTVGERTHSLGPGQFTLLPRGTPQALRPGVGGPPRVLQISSPGGWECFVEDMVEAGPQLMVDGRLDPARLNRIADRHGIRYADGARHRQEPGPHGGRV